MGNGGQGVCGEGGGTGWGGQSGTSTSTGLERVFTQRSKKWKENTHKDGRDG